MRLIKKKLQLATSHIPCIKGGLVNYCVVGGRHLQLHTYIPYPVVDGYVVDYEFLEVCMDMSYGEGCIDLTNEIY